MGSVVVVTTSWPQAQEARLVVMVDSRGMASLTPNVEVEGPPKERH